MKKAVEYLLIIVMVMLVIAAVFTYIAPHFGWRVDAVLSGSMEPQVMTGSLVVTRPVEPEAIAVGDIITFRQAAAAETLITHRVTGIGQSSFLYFETKGDANDKPDPFTVPARNMVGKVCFHAPYWGYATEFLKTPVGFIFALVIPGSILIAMYAISMWRALARDRMGRASNEERDES